jgi:opacity protein-like surface antigen
MKSIFIALVLFILLPRIATAQKPADPPRGLVYIFAGGGTAGMDLNAGFGAEVRVANGFGAGGELGAIGLGASDKNKNTGLASFNFNYHYFQKRPRIKWAPFATAGVSDFFGHNTHTEYGGGGAYHTFGFNFGGGLDVFATRHVGVRFETRYYGHGGRILNWVYPNVQQFSFVALRAGITFR